MLTTTHAKALGDILARWRAAGQTIGFVPTMGALHDGHLSLVEIAQKKADRVVVSIFVNPTQFAPHEDFNSYPREEKKDLTRLQHAGAHLAYLPSEKEMYPQGRDSAVKAGEAAAGLESDFRPHFFDGVVNVVYRLFEQVKPDIAVFGEKDFQQLQVIREMVAAQNLPIEIIGAPIARDKHGLALSSRNAYLSKEQIEIARKFNKILFELSASLRAQRSNPETTGLPRQPEGLLAMTQEAKTSLVTAGFDKVDYVEERWGRILAAAWIGKTRLIDNVAV